MTFGHRNILLVAAATFLLLAAVGTASAATAPPQMPQPALSFEFTNAPNISQIIPLHVVTFTLVVYNHGKVAQDGSMVFPSWVRLGGKANNHLVFDKIGELTWNFSRLNPGQTRTLKVPVVVTTAWHQSSCAPGSWPFKAELYSELAPAVAVSQELCYGFGGKGGG